MTYGKLAKLAAVGTEEMNTLKLKWPNLPINEL